jgi:hypothetical protein
MNKSQRCVSWTVMPPGRSTQQHDKLHASAIENPVKRSTVMAAQFRKLSFYLRTMWKGHMGIRLVKKVDPLDLPIDSELDRRFLVLNKLIYRLGAVARSIELCDEWRGTALLNLGMARWSGERQRSRRHGR